MSVKSAVKAFITRHCLEGCSLLVAVSGGVDSIVLLHVLRELCDGFNLYLEVAHLDHGLRGESSAADANFVSRKAEELGLVATIERRPVSADGESVEEAARRVRFNFLREVAEGKELDYVALGHTRDDQAETILMNLIRGAGLKGLSGMSEKRGRYIRPLLKVKSEEIEEYADENGLDYRVDETNKDKSYTRNRLRHDLIPKIQKEYNPNFEQRLIKTADLVRQARQVLEDRVESIWNRISTSPGGRCGVCIDTGELKTCSPYIRKGLIRKGIFEAKGDLKDITATHVELIEKEALEMTKKVKLDLPGVTFVGNDDRSCFFVGYEQEPPQSYTFEVSPGGEVKIDQIDLKLSFSVLRRKDAPDLTEIADDPRREIVNWNKVEPPIIVRTREDGDRLIPLGMEGTKKIKDFLLDLKVPVEERDRLPLVCDNRGIIWVVGYRIDERYKVNSSTDIVLLMKARDI